MNAQTPITSGWAVELLGERFDLDQWRDDLAPPYDPWIEEYIEDATPKLLLRSNAWANLSEARRVDDDATRVIEQLNGAMQLVYPDAKPVTKGALLKFRADGYRDTFVMVTSARIQMRGVRMRARVSAPASADESRVQQLIRSAGGDQQLATLLSEIARADSWVALYIAAERARTIAGGERKLAKSLGVSGWVEWKRCWVTANANRHAPDPIRFPVPVPTPTFEEARENIFAAIARMLG